MSPWLEQHRRRVLAMFADGTARQYRLLVEDGQLVQRLLTEPRTPPQDLLPVAAERSAVVRSPP